MDNRDDPRIVLAAERTLLAWIRTGLAVIALGFLLTRHSGGDRLVVSIGVALALSGSVAALLSAWNYRRLFHELGTNFHSQRDLVAWAIWFAVVIGLIGMVLVIDLLFQSLSAISV